MLTLTRQEWRETRQAAIRVAAKQLRERFHYSPALARRLAREQVERNIAATRGEVRKAR